VATTRQEIVDGVEHSVQWMMIISEMPARSRGQAAGGWRSRWVRRCGSANGSDEVRLEGLEWSTKNQDPCTTPCYPGACFRTLSSAKSQSLFGKPHRAHLPFLQLSQGNLDNRQPHSTRNGVRILGSLIMFHIHRCRPACHATLGRLSLSATHSVAPARAPPADSESAAGAPRQEHLSDPNGM
jgi:hypothetical protein